MKMNSEAIHSRYIKLLANIKDYFNRSDELIWDRRNKIKVLSFDDEKLTVKAFKIPHIVNRLAYTFFRPSKAKRSYLNSMKIEAFTPKAVGYIEFKKLGLIYDSYYISAYYPYDFTIREVLQDEEFPDREKILKAFTYFSYQLHEAGAKHLDYSPGNILIKQENDEYLFKVIDLNRMYFGRMEIQERIENFSKLWANNRDLEKIASCYAKLVGIEESKASQWLIAASSAHKERVNFKKRIKGKRIENG